MAGVASAADFSVSQGSATFFGTALESDGGVIIDNFSLRCASGHQDIGHEPGVRCSNHKCITRTELYVPLHGKIGDRCPYCDKLLELDI